MSDGDAQYTGLIEAIYNAALAPESWARVLGSLADYFDCASAALGVMSAAQQVQLVHLSGVIADPDMVARYRAYYGQFDPWPAERARRPAGQVALSSETFDLDYVKQSPFVNEYFIPSGLVDSMGTALLRDDQNVALIGLQRTNKRGTFSRADSEAFARFVPHLGMALRVHRGLGGLRRTGGLTDLLLDRLATGVLALGADGALVYANAAAERMLARRNGLEHDGRSVTTRDHAARGRLQRLLAEILGKKDGPGGVVRIDAGAGAAYAVLVAPLRRDLGSDALPWPFQGAMVLIRDESSAVDTMPEQLRGLYGLSIAEASLLQSLLGGITVLQHAARAGIRPTTARFHLRHVLQKTGTVGQSQLMRKVVGDLAGLPLLR